MEQVYSLHPGNFFRFGVSYFRFKGIEKREVDGYGERKVAVAVYASSEEEKLFLLNHDVVMLSGPWQMLLDIATSEKRVCFIHDLLGISTVMIGQQSVRLVGDSTEDILTVSIDGGRFIINGVPVQTLIEVNVMEFGDGNIGGYFSFEESQTD